MKQLHLCKLLVIVLFCFGTTLNAQKAKVPASKKVQKAWIKSYNKGADKALTNSYSKNSGILIDGEIQVGNEKLLAQLQKLKTSLPEIKKYKSLGVHQLYPNNKFELGLYKGAKGQAYYTVIGWSLEKTNSWVKEFEVFYPKAEGIVVSPQAADKGRMLWEQYSNEHRPDLLVDKVCMPDGYYFNRGKIYQGQEIKEVYNYMSNPNWSIKLASLQAIPVNDQLLYDVGTFQTKNGKGLYALIWQKEGADWKVLLDFNF